MWQRNYFEHVIPTRTIWTPFASTSPQTR